MSLHHKTDDELIALTRHFSKFHECAPVLKELVKRWQEQLDITNSHHQQMLTMAAESELIRQHLYIQKETVSELVELQNVPLLGIKVPKLSPEKLRAVADYIKKLAQPCPTIVNAVNLIRTVELVDMQRTLHASLSGSPRIQQIDPMDRMAVTYSIDSSITRRIAELLYLPITAVAIERDGDGFWSHPASALEPEWDEGTSVSEIEAWFRTHELEVDIVSLEDQDEDLFERCIVEGNCSAWDPAPPEGDGWFLFSIFDSDEGVHAQFVRPNPVTEWMGAQGGVA